MLTQEERARAMSVPGDVHDLDELCASCGLRWGTHTGALCRGGKSVFVEMGTRASPAQSVSQTTKEPTRAPLDWNKSTPFDPFEGFEVESDPGDANDHQDAGRFDRTMHERDSSGREDVFFP
jgi:hypothetical protein